MSRLPPGPYEQQVAQSDIAELRSQLGQDQEDLEATLATASDQVLNAGAYIQDADAESAIDCLHDAVHQCGIAAGLKERIAWSERYIAS